MTVLILPARLLPVYHAGNRSSISAELGRPIASVYTLIITYVIPDVFGRSWKDKVIG